MTRPLRCARPARPSATAYPEKGNPTAEANGGTAPPSVAGSGPANGTAPLLLAQDDRAQAQAQRLGLHAAPSCRRGNPDDAAAARRCMLASSSSSLPGRALAPYAYGGAQLMPLPLGLDQRARGPPPPLPICSCCSSPRCCRVARQCLHSQKWKPNQRSLISKR